MKNKLLTGLEQAKKLVKEISQNNKISVNSVVIERSVLTEKIVNIELSLSLYREEQKPGAGKVEGSFISTEPADSED
ncbi:MAG: hypothetical protein UR18_C0006G0041 [Candidatus Nomurabacteria bacterium GW2011_GWE2_31_40]|nr:MAG: hypothetical protein UR18_C0006G0041 [Candidatus Nomurabacteria bacterium GW2011_GWE2_31_40]OGV06183.1 MAG: hypothetical protein A2299_12155 [Stygiobacter sp. RIFOXYB2_FULL_37_11]OGV15934.1 MAG: hypothetical protein A2440_03090 [Stygiobacter sp. RIFOXYC2_FULL_38_25]OGV27877.1 MAG: hypothetical protein A2499_17190 [Stygiobacter sp. RIFOXYC12_FULL_38_8]OGV80411.1 MAG: hypothetical protein A2X65_04250 [Stygiobacter sp. GWF2_38_21]